jgi:pyruvate formate lyase activating enzyme
MKNTKDLKGGKSPRIAGFVRNSFVDWPGNISFVVFLGGCNFRCPHCHNHNILCSTSNTIPFTEALYEIKSQYGFIDGVVISGGEPTEHPHLHEMIAAIRELNLPVKLDTNGSHFEILRSLVDGGLVDFVAMDIKAPLEKYIKLGFTKSKADVENVRQSVEYLKNIAGGVGVMFRTTPIPELTESDITEIQKIAGSVKWVKNTFKKPF